MDEALARALSDLGSLCQDSHSPLSESTLRDLQSLFGHGDDDCHLLFSEMAERSLPASSLVHHLTLSMDSPDVGVALAASSVYLSALLAPSAPLYTLFTPLAFLSLLGSLRRAFRQFLSPSPMLPPSLTASSRNEAGRKKRRPPASRGDPRSSGVEGTTQIDSQIVLVLERLNLFLSKVHLNRFPESLKSLVDTLAEMLVMGINAFEKSANYSRFSSLCFRIMKGVLRSEHGDETVVATQVLKALSPTILLLKSPLRTLALKFVTESVATLAKESDKTRQCLVSFPRYLIDKSLEKSDHRAVAVESVMEIVKAMDCGDQIKFAHYVVKMTEGKLKLRLIAVDLIPILLTVLPEPFSREYEDSWGPRCLEALFRRCWDVSPAIRARSLSNLANAIEFLSSYSVQVSEVLGFANGKLNYLLRKRCRDEKAAVRKAALLLIMKSTAWISGKVDEDMVRLISYACSDPLVSIRKAAVSALSEVNFSPLV